jgi:CheY-like chemotaxis protein
MNTPLRILVAEDEVGDVLFLKRAFAKAGVSSPVYFAGDGQEVLDYLEGYPPFDNPVEYPLPNLLLLDLGLPRVNGLEVLSWVRQHPTLHQMLVVVLSSSEDPEEIQRAYELGANAYVVKPHNPANLVDVVRRVQEYWLGINIPAKESLITI